MIFQCIFIDCSWYFIIVGVPQNALEATTDSADVTLTFLSLLESFLVALMKSLRPWMYSSYSSSVMSPFSTSTCGRWGSEETHSEPRHRRHYKYKAGEHCLKLKPSDCISWVLPVACGHPKTAARAPRSGATLFSVNYSAQVNSDHFFCFIWINNLMISG